MYQTSLTPRKNEPCFYINKKKSITGSLLGTMNWVQVYTFSYLDHLKERVIPVSGLLGYLVPEEMANFITLTMILTISRKTEDLKIAKGSPFVCTATVQLDYAEPQASYGKTKCAARAYTALQAPPACS